MTGTGVGDSGISISAISRGNLEPAAEARMADSRKADALVAVTCHPICASHICTFAQAEGGLHFCTSTSHHSPRINQLLALELLKGETGEGAVIDEQDDDGSAGKRVGERNEFRPTLQRLW